MNGWMDGWIYGCTCMDAWMYGYMDEWMYGRMDVMYVCNVCVYVCM